jgi:hypothetical protein
MNAPVFRQDMDLFHEIGARNRARSLSFNQPGDDDPSSHRIGPCTENVSKRSSTRRHRLTVLVKDFVTPDGPLRVMACEAL